MSGGNLSYLGFDPNIVFGDFGDSKAGDGSVDGDLVGDRSGWVKYRDRSIEWLVGSIYSLENSGKSGDEAIVAGNIKGLDGYGSSLADELAQSDGDHYRIMLVDGLQFASIAVTVGAMGWAVHAGGLLTSLLVGMPVWREFDPLPVVAEDDDKKKRVEKDEDSDTDEEELAAHLLETGQFKFGARG
jgi:hypothetical protein